MELDFADSSSYCIISNTGARQTHTALETVSCARTLRSWCPDSVRVKHFATLRKRAKNAAAGSSKVLQEEEVVVPKHVWNIPSDDESEAVKVL